MASSTAGSLSSADRRPPATKADKVTQEATSRDVVTSGQSRGETPLHAAQVIQADPPPSKRVKSWQRSRLSPVRFRTALFNGVFQEREQDRALGMDQVIGIVRTWAQQCLHHDQVLRQRSASFSGGNEGADYFHGGPASSLLSEPSPSSSAGAAAGTAPLAGSPGLTARTTSIVPSPNSPRYAPPPIDEESLLETRELLQSHVLIILRMSINCPFPDVRQRFSAFLQELRLMNVHIPTPLHASHSFFIRPEKLVSLEQANELTRQVMGSIFIANGRFSNISRILSYFPNYLEKMTRSYHQVMRLQGPLPNHWRHYIGIMASAQHQCQYLVSLQTREYLLQGGDPEWLNGLSFAPKKLQNLAIINTTLAHQPWLMDHRHVENLVKGTDNWSMSELVQAMVVLTTFHSLSSFVMGCGIAPEIDMPGGTHDDLQEDGLLVNTTANDAEEQDSELFKETEQLLDRLKHKAMLEEEEVVVEASSASSAAPQGNPATTQKEEVFRNCDQDIATAAGLLVPPPQPTSTEPLSVTPPADAVTNGSSAPASPTASGILPMNFIYEDLSRFLGSPSLELKHTDFNFKSTTYTVFRLEDYSWEEHGCSLVAKYLPETAEYLDEQFSAILNLTDYSLYDTRKGSEQVDTWPFRQAIWYYVLRLSGMSHDDYNYHEVNIYLNRQIKQYIKKVACYPEEILLSDFQRMGFQFRPDEKVQINLLAAEARKCAELLYALHALMR